VTPTVPLAALSRADLRNNARIQTNPTRAGARTSRATAASGTSLGGGWRGTPPPSATTTRLGAAAAGTRPATTTRLRPTSTTPRWAAVCRGRDKGWAVGWGCSVAAVLPASPLPHPVSVCAPNQPINLPLLTLPTPHRHPTHPRLPPHPPRTASATTSPSGSRTSRRWALTAGASTLCAATGGSL